MWKLRLCTRLLVLLGACVQAASRGEDVLNLSVDCSKITGEIRALNGGNCGPIQFGGLLDLSAPLKELRMPYSRLHDCHWPNPDVVDIHTIFPNFDADPANADSYDFRRTDDYIQSVAEMNSEVIYRLGESIEHSKRKYYVHPPKDYDKWAAICAGIVAHYNDGWAGGPKRNIRYWEIWNEPENRPAMWSGTDEDYFKLYEITARVLKKRWPELKVGGPAVGYTGKLANRKFEPGEFIVHFLQRCKERKIPLDFFSWHLYTDDPAECAARAKGIRALLDEYGFNKTESHFNEWNYLPGNDWSPLGLLGQGVPRERFFEALGGARGGAFAACVLLNLQDAPVDVANYYASDNIGFGLFSPNGVPRKAYYAFKAFRQLLDMRVRIATQGGGAGFCSVCAAMNQDKSEVGVLIGNYRNEAAAGELNLNNLPWKGSSQCEMFIVDGARNLQRICNEKISGTRLKLPDDFRAPAVLLIKIKSADEH